MLSYEEKISIKGTSNLVYDLSKIFREDIDDVMIDVVTLGIDSGNENLNKFMEDLNRAQVTVQKITNILCDLEHMAYDTTKKEKE